MSRFRHVNAVGISPVRSIFLVEIRWFFLFRHRGNNSETENHAPKRGLRVLKFPLLKYLRISVLLTVSPFSVTAGSIAVYFIIAAKRLKSSVFPFPAAEPKAKTGIYVTGIF